MHSQRADNFLTRRFIRKSGLACALCLFLVSLARAEQASASTGLSSEASAVSWSAHVETCQETELLSPGASIRREMGGGKTHCFRLTLTQGQFTHLIVEQKGVDVDIKITGPDGQTVAEMDSPNGLNGPEAVSVIAQSAGDYVIVLHSDNSVPGGSYELSVESLREPTASDHERVNAEQLFNEGQKLRYKRESAAWSQAIDKYQQSLALWRTLGDVRGQAFTTCNIGRVQKSLCDISKAIANLNQAASLLQEIHDASGEAWMLNELGAIYRTQGDSGQALKQYERALELRRGTGDLWGQAQLLNNMGLAYANMGRHQQAIDLYQQSLSLWERTQDQASQYNTRNNLYLSSSELGDMASALNNFQQLLESLPKDEYRGLEANIQNNMGKIYDSLAESQAALDHYQIARDTFQDIGNLEGAASVLDNIGMVHASLGDAVRALGYFSEALDIRGLLCSRRGLGITNTNIGYAYTIKGEALNAIKYFDRALLLNREAQNLPFVAYALVSKGMAYVSLNKQQEALELYRQALSIQTELGDRRGQAITLDKMGQVYAATGTASRALNTYRQALQLWTSVGDKQGQALTLYGIAKVESNRNNLEEARKRIEEAIQIIESLRTNLVGEKLRLNYFATKQDYYALNIDVRMRLFNLTSSVEHRDAALYASEHARARNLLEVLVEAGTDIHREIPPQFAEQERSLKREINALADKLIRARNLGLTKEVAALRSRLDASTNEFDDVQAKIRASNKSYAELKRPESLGTRQIQQLLDNDTLLLEYSLGEQRSYLWAVTRTEVESHLLPARAKIEAAVTNLRALLTAYEPPKQGESSLAYLQRLHSSASQYRLSAAELSQTLLGPVSSRLRMKRIVIIADGALLYLPFEALPVPDRSVAASSSRPQTHTSEPEFLVSNHEILYEPSATTLALLRKAPRRETNGSVAVLADPVYNADDDRVTVDLGKPAPKSAESPPSWELNRALRDVGETGAAGGVFKLERLRHSAEEANGIVEAAPEGSWLKVVGFEANRKNALSPELGRYRIVHLATHGILDDKHPELSGVVLSLVNERGQPEDGFLRLSDIYNLSLSADLVVLSACQTGLGKNVRGEGLIGLTRGFMYAGAKRVLASLWKVDDEATAELMKRFYHHLLKDQIPAASALALAKMELMQAREQWRAPYFWAGFILQGDWN
jgi:CHAT domain-containing protein/Tfp pilus assembly protein PilF